MGLLLLAVLLPLTTRALVGRRGAVIYVRWEPSITDAGRRNLESRFHLADGEMPDAATWKYDLLDVSPGNIRALVAEPAVADTHALDRATGRLAPSAVRTSRRLRASTAGDRIVAVSDFLAMLAGVIAALTLVRVRLRIPAATARWVRARWTVPSSATRARLDPAVDLSYDDRPRLWTAAVMAVWAPLVIILCVTLWRTPFPINEAVALLEDTAARPPARFLIPDTAYYRPFFYFTLSALWHHGGTLGTTLAGIRLMTIIPVVLIVALFIWHLRPRTGIDAAAAGIAVAVLVGSPGFRDNLEIGLSYTIVGMLIALVVWILLNREWRPWHAPLVVVLTLVAIGFKEQGLVLVPLVIVASWTRASGSSRAMAVTLGTIAVAYVALRLSWRGSWELFQQDLGLGFAEIEKGEAAVRFAAFPYWMYVYNGASTVANVLFAEPTRGIFRIVRAVTDGETELWQIIHAGSSVALTGVITWWGIRALKRNSNGNWSPQSRLFVATGVIVLACGALSFNYSRDRLGGMAVVFYAMAAFFALREAAAQALAASRARFVMASLGLVLLGAAWHTRAVATLEYAHVHSWGNQEEWFVRLASRRIEHAHRTVYLRIMESMVEQGIDPAAPRTTRFPDWVLLIIGEV